MQVIHLAPFLDAHAAGSAEGMSAALTAIKEDTALPTLRSWGWLVGAPNEFGIRPALCKTCRRALAAAILAGAVKLDPDDRLLAGGRP